ncbi:MAG TPA: hydroxyisourate hydrolase [Gemmatimonadales bacterium]|jgi:5-hydroxyisourate hydrolase|nr:hydroxyisourate hydrolase [Gemmatimonadales bacterium]
MSTLSTHVLDTALGKPARGIPVSLERDGAVLGSAVTDTDGRVKTFPALAPGFYRLSFAVGEYFKLGGRESLYTTIVIQFTTTQDSDHYHIPLLLSPFGYTTYRGS